MVPQGKHVSLCGLTKDNLRTQLPQSRYGRCTEIASNVGDGNNRSHHRGARSALTGGLSAVGR
jgi:hypothetical protein